MTTILTMCAGAGMAIYYAFCGQDLWIPCLLWLTALPAAVMYVIILLYSLLAMLSFWDAFSRHLRGRRLATLLFSPFFMLEYFPIFIQSRVYARTSLEWEQTERVKYDREQKK